MKLKNVIDEFGTACIIDEDTRKIYTYSNKDHKVEYNAQKVENGEPVPSYVNYIDEGTVDEIEDRLKTWNNRLMISYASAVNFNASKYDPDGALYADFVNFIKENEDRFFDEHGDFRKNFVISEKEIQQLVKTVNG